MTGDVSLVTEELEIAGMSCESCVAKIQKSLENLKGIEKIEVKIGSVKVSFYDEVISIKNIADEIEAAGYKIKKPGNNKNLFERFIDRLIQSNKKNFGTKRLDCCDLDKE